MFVPLNDYHMRLKDPEAATEAAAELDAAGRAGWEAVTAITLPNGHLAVLMKKGADPN